MKRQRETMRLSLRRPRVGGRVLKTGALAVCVLTAGMAHAQLTADDIAALRARGEEEGWTFTVGENGATAYPLEALCGFAGPPPDMGRPPAPESLSRKKSLPKRFDWRDWGGVTTPGWQLMCGSCWAFAAAGVMESRLRLNGISDYVSEQWLLSCTEAGDCDGGHYQTAFDYLACEGDTDPCDDSGAVLAEDFPYAMSDDVPCSCPYAHPHCLDGWHHVNWSDPESPSVDEIKAAIFDHGPVAAGVFADAAFEAYESGVFNACTDNVNNHAIVLVGWDDDLGTDGAWILLNSWGPFWGEWGFMYIEYGCSNVGAYAAFVDYTETHDGAWVDFEFTGTETGSYWNPFDTLAEGVTWVVDGGVVMIKAGATGTPITVKKPVILNARGGPVTIGL